MSQGQRFVVLSVKARTTHPGPPPVLEQRLYERESFDI